MRAFLWVLELCLLTACLSPAVEATSTPLPTRPPVTRTPRPTVTPYPTPTRAPTWTPESTLSPTPEAWYLRYSVPSLRERPYGTGQLEIVEQVEENDSFSRYLIRYPSDNLTIYGYANLPRGAGPFPVIIMLHGRAALDGYETLKENDEYARLYASHGFIVLHPNLRNYPPSDPGENYFLAGMAVDVLNLIALVKTESGQPGLLQAAAPAKIGLWAFSMGGALAWRVLVISPDIRAAFLYSPMSANDSQNAAFLAASGTDPEAEKVLTLPAYAFASLSPDNFYPAIQAAVDIHHGTADRAIPVDWSKKACEELTRLGKTVHCYYYENSDHVFSGNAGLKLEQRMLNFFTTHLKNPAPSATPGP